MNKLQLLKTLKYLIKSKFLLYSGLTSITTAHTLSVFLKDNKYIDF